MEGGHSRGRRGAGSQQMDRRWVKWAGPQQGEVGWSGAGPQQREGKDSREVSERNRKYYSLQATSGGQAWKSHQLVASGKRSDCGISFWVSMGQSPCVLSILK